MVVRGGGESPDPERALKRSSQHVGVHRPGRVTVACYRHRMRQRVKTSTPITKVVEGVIDSHQPETRVRLTPHAEKGWAVLEIDGDLPLASGEYQVRADGPRVWLFGIEAFGPGELSTP